MKYAKVLIALVCIVAFLFTAQTALAKGKKKKKEELDDRRLNGHNFLRPFQFPLAIPTTNVGVGFGYAYFRTDLDEEIDLIVVKGDQFSAGGLNEVLDVEVSFLKRFSIEMMLEGRALVGVDEESALIFGGRGQYQAMLIPKVMVYQNDKWGTCISVSSDVMWDQGVWSSPAVLMVQLLENFADLLDDIIQTGNVDEDDIEDAANINLKQSLVTETFLGIRPSLLWAQTLHPAFGIQVGLRYMYGISQTVDAPDLFEWEEGDPPTAFAAGTVATFDLNPISRAHMGFKLEVDYEMEEDDNEDWTTLTVGGGIMYTGRKSLELGTTFYHDSGEGEDQVESDYYLVLNMRYFF